MRPFFGAVQFSQRCLVRALDTVKVLVCDAQDIKAFYHPKDLPNDPPGKASNVAYAFKQLCAEAGKSDISNVVLTIADADSEFGAGYFESLSCQFASTKSRFKIWQSPVFHMKNYHRQPAPVVVGTMFTSMRLGQHFNFHPGRWNTPFNFIFTHPDTYLNGTEPFQKIWRRLSPFALHGPALPPCCPSRQELSGLTDPNAVRFPYSTYSLPMTLARDVGGWDVDWIAEDYHMGIKRLTYA